MNTVSAILIILTGIICAGPIEDLKPGFWYEVPNSRLQSVAPKPADYPEIQGHTGVNGVMNAWAGGALDTKRNRLYVTGGGHWDYFGNELYAFDLDSLRWLRLTDPSPLMPNNDTIPYPYPATCPDDSVPCSGHTYDGIEYIPPPVDRLFLKGRSNYGYVKTATWSGKRAYLFHPDSLYWKSMAEYIDLGESDLGLLCAADSVTGKVFMRTTGNRCRLSSFTAATNTWSSIVFPDATNGFFSYNYNASIDHVNRVMVAVGNGIAWAWDIRDPSSTNSKAVRLLMNGDTAATVPFNPGFDFDSKIGKFVSWIGGTDVYTFDYPTKTFTKYAAAPSNSTTPTPPNPSGTFGRFRYVPSKDVFVVVNTVNTNVFVYRLAESAASIAAPINKRNTPFTIIPNPFNPSCKISFMLPEKAIVRLEVFGPNGNLVQKLVSGVMAAGNHTLVWNGTDLHAGKVVTGLYLYRLTIKDRVMTQKALLCK